jgi:hypothetical protein
MLEEVDVEKQIRVTSRAPADGLGQALDAAGGR